jgi:hypothetical protein
VGPSACGNGRLTCGELDRLWRPRRPHPQPPQPVGQYFINRTDLANPHRVLTWEGKVSASFSWPDGRSGDPRTMLESEGIAFDERGRADPSCRMSPEDLAQLIGLEESQLPPPAPREAGDDTRATRFDELLDEYQLPEVAEAVRTLLKDWRSRGGELWHGRGTDTSCLPLLRTGIEESTCVYPVAFYPVSGTVEVAFQYMGRRAPFDDIRLRRELLRRLNEIPGVHLAEAKLALRPSFPMVLLPGEGAERLGEVFRWFAETARRGGGAE